jgi:hypothetical protein
MLNDCLIQINKYKPDDKDILKEWYQALVEDGSLSHQMTTLEQINILLRDTGLFKEFRNKTTNTSISTKTLFRKL